MTEPWTSVMNKLELIDTREEGITEDDAEALLKLHRSLKRKDTSDFNHRDILCDSYRLAREVDNISHGWEDERKADEVVDYIRSNHDGWTASDYRTAYRQFAQYTWDEEGMPSHIEDISTSAKGVEPRPNKEDYITQDEAEEMIRSCSSDRDKALIAVAFEAGPRGGELYNMTYGDVRRGDSGMSLTFFGKTKEQRHVSLYWANTWLARWLEEYPSDSPEDDAPLWCRIRDSHYGDPGEQISQRALYNIFESAAEKADVDKKVTPTNFRKSNAYYLSQFSSMNIRDINVRQGRKPESDEIRPYLMVDGTDADKNYREGLGIEEPDEQGLDIESIKPIHCSKCNRESPAGSEACQWCGVPFTDDASDTQEKIGNELVETLKRDPELAEDAGILLNALESSTELREAVAEYRE